VVRSDRRLRDQGFRVQGLGDARTALAWLARARADVVIADVLLPGSRIAVPHLVRRRHSATCPILIGLADEGSDCAALAQVLGFDAVVPRSTPMAVLHRRVHRLLTQAGTSLPR
jgi:DNA-binding response OmpR family regulator